MKTLENLRTEIDKIDQQLIALVDQRIAVAKQIQQYKKSTGLSTEDLNREHLIIKNLCERYPKVPQETIRSIYQSLFDSSKK
jgi:chorismate mutase